MEVLILIGMATTFAWYYLIIIGFPGYFPAQAEPLIRRIVQLAAFLGIISGAFFAIRKPRNFSKNAYRHIKTISWGLIGCVVPVLVILETFGIYVPVPFTWLMMGATGFGAGYFFTGWEDLSSKGRLRDTLISVGLAMIAAVGLFLLVSLTMTGLAQGVMAILFIAFGSVLFYIVSLRRSPREEEDAKKKGKANASGEEEALDDEEEDDRHTFNTKLSAVLVLVNFPLGFGLPFLYTFDSVLFFIALTVALLALVAFVILARFIVKDMTFIVLLRGVIAVVCVGLLIAGINADLLPVSCIILFATWLVLRLAHAETLIRLTRVQKLNPVYLNVRGKIPGYLGFIIGFLVSIVTAWFVGYENTAVFIAVGLAVEGVLVVGALVLLPFSESYSKQLSVVPVIVDPSITSPEDIERAKCAELAKRFNLSPREEEILFFIVRGRNARFIAEKLVISESTAKTHIHNIYKKSGIHSQQKFIDIMDELV